METKELQAIVNPIYTTAKGTVLMLKGGGDPDAEKLAPYLDLSEIQNNNRLTPPPDIKRCYRVAQEARYGIYNMAALKSGKPIIVDLPCGYSPRGFRVTDAGKVYFGFDLPIVINEMKNASKKAMSEQQRAASTFASVDATNYESLRNALGDVKGELCIVTEGLLGYFNESELVSMCQAIHRLLAEFGGCWITADSGILEIYSLTFGTLFKGDQKAFLEQMKGHATRMADVNFYQNSLFLNGPEGAKSFLKNQGFHVKAESVSNYLPEMRTVSGEEFQQLEKAYQTYVSSAGLRVLLMMYRSLADKDRFEMTGVSEEVREILETTGFDQFLLKE